MIHIYMFIYIYIGFRVGGGEGHTKQKKIRLGKEAKEARVLEMRRG
jgi:hypothetical protein